MYSPTGHSQFLQPVCLFELFGLSIACLLFVLSNCLFVLPFSIQFVNCFPEVTASHASTFFAFPWGQLAKRMMGP